MFSFIWHNQEYYVHITISIFALFFTKVHCYTLNETFLVTCIWRNCIRDALRNTFSHPSSKWTSYATVSHINGTIKGLRSCILRSILVWSLFFLKKVEVRLHFLHASFGKLVFCLFVFCFKSKCFESRLYVLSLFETL